MYKMERVMKYLVVAFVMICSSVWAEDYKLGDLTVMEPFSYPTNGRSAAGYFTLTNDGPADFLMSVTADFPRVMIHESLMQDGVMTMQHRTIVEVPERGEIEFGPGGYHVMFMGLDEDWTEGDEIEASLQFKSAGTLNIKFVVIVRP
tara:strand:- start:25 stop:465 length:441 start_codon:yes stop_codon:yes gene_type:complete